jgi:molybdenum cofactor cytidylyltransferase
MECGTTVTAGLILAAGASRRLGRIKQLLPLGGRPLLAWPLAALRAAGAHPIVVVLGHEAATIQAAGILQDVQVVINPAYAAGMSTTLHRGLAALEEGVGAAWVLAGDQPFVTADHLRALRARQDATGLPIVATAFSDHQGVPMLLHRTAWPLLASLHGDQGARGVLQQHPTLLASVPAPDPSLALDVDTERDYQTAHHFISSRPNPWKGLGREEITLSAAEGASDASP